MSSAPKSVNEKANNHTRRNISQFDLLNAGCCLETKKTFWQSSSSWRWVATLMCGYIRPLRLLFNIRILTWGYLTSTGVPGGSVVKESTCRCRRHKRHGFDPWVGKILWSRKWQPTPVFLPGKFHGQRSLEGYKPWGHKELDMTEHTHTLDLYSLSSVF